MPIVTEYLFPMNLEQNRKETPADKENGKEMGIEKGRKKRKKKSENTFTHLYPRATVQSIRKHMPLP